MKNIIVKERNLYKINFLSLSNKLRTINTNVNCKIPSTIINENVIYMDKNIINTIINDRIIKLKKIARELSIPTINENDIILGLLYNMEAIDMVYSIVCEVLHVITTSSLREYLMSDIETLQDIKASIERVI